MKNSPPRFLKDPLIPFSKVTTIKFLLYRSISMCLLTCTCTQCLYRNILETIYYTNIPSNRLLSLTPFTELHHFSVMLATALVILYIFF